MIMPRTKPRLTQADLQARLEPYGIDRTKYPLVVVGIRGYYRRNMGDPTRNDRGIYDDALFIDAPEAFAAFNANTDPSVFRPGIAVLKPGVYYAHKFDYHRSKHGAHFALCQRAGPVTVIRDGNPPYEDTGMFGINIHRGGTRSTSSLGCQTIPPGQWSAFIALAQEQAERLYGAKWKTHIVPYVLVEEV